MKKKDFLVILITAALLAPFFLSPVVYGWYKTFNVTHPVVMSFLKFAVLATFGECIGLRITNGVYNKKGFGVLPRAVVWGFLGIGIAFAINLFFAGTPVALAQFGMTEAPAVIAAHGLTLLKVLVSFCISLSINLIFAPVFMTLHKVTDTHIVQTGGTLRGFFTTRLPMGATLAGLDWKRQWGFVFKKTIPFFWIPAHTVTFLLPGDMRVLFAALLGIALGVLLSLAALKK
ncbi:MAG: hypothetical protein FWE10_01160 [Rikenellaceae bacterium]|nr:hypothetical protein [Rikenellaceae bacterium]MCL2692346.1 hypothetical protein [Rikenellaceae bacterium]